MHIKSLKTAILLAELRSFRAVADNLCVTQAAVSSRIHAMEQELGVKLFDRDSRGVSLTPDGEKFIEGGRLLVRDYERLALSMTQDAPLAGTVKIGLNSSMAQTLLPLIADEMRLRYERVRFVIHCDTNAKLLTLLSAGELDCALVPADRHFDAFEQIPLCSFGSRWVASPAFLQEHHVTGRVDPATLAAFPIIAYEIGTPGHERLLTRFTEAELAQTDLHISNSVPTSISMASAGIGIATVPPVVIQRELQEGSLRVIDTDRHLPMLRYLAVKSDKAPSARSGALAQIAQDCAIRFCEHFDDTIAMADNPDTA